MDDIAEALVSTDGQQLPRVRTRREFATVDDILALSQSNYEEVKELPDRDRLTYTNGFYAYCSALFIDIRDSSKLPQFYRRPALAKVYRAHISESVAIMNSDEQAREINIVGDCVWGIFNTPSSYFDASLWEEAKRKGEAAIRAMIDAALVNTAVTVVLIGQETTSRAYVKYEIDKSVARGNGLLGIRMEKIKNRDGSTDYPGASAGR